MGTIIVGSATQQKGITVNPSTVIFNGGNVQKIMNGSDVIWGLRPLITPMISNISDIGIAVGSLANDDNSTFYKAFDQDPSTYYQIKGQTSNGYLGFIFTTNKTVTRVDITNKLWGDYYRVKDFIVQASNDTTDGLNGTWADLSDTLTCPADASVNSFDLENSTAYKSYRIHVINNWGGTNPALFITELQMYGH